MARFTDEELLFLSNLIHMKYEEVIDEFNNNHGSPFEDIWIILMSILGRLLI